MIIFLYLRINSICFLFYLFLLLFLSFYKFLFNSTNSLITMNLSFFPSYNQQCLKESQKVSVIERKSSRVGQSGKNMVTETAAQSSISNSATNITNRSGVVAGRSGPVTSGGGGSTSSTTNSFFRLFTSSSSKKIIPFAFSSSNHSNNSPSFNQSQSIPYSVTQSTLIHTCSPSGGGSSSSTSSSSSTHTITARSDIIGLSGHYPKRMNGSDQLIKPNKSCLLDSATNNTAGTMTSFTDNHLGLSSNSSSSDSAMPANEVLFRKYFTFYDLMSSTNLNRLFKIPDSSSGTINSTNSSTSSISTSSLSVSSTSGVMSMESNNSTYHHQHLITNSQSGTTVTTFESSTMSSTSSYSSCTSSMFSASHSTLPSASAMSQQYQQQYYLKTNTLPTSVTSNVTNHTNSINGMLDGIGNELLASSLNFLNE